MLRAAIPMDDLLEGGAQTMNAGFKIPTRIDAEPAGFRFDARVYLNFVWRHWMFIGAVVVLALIMALIYLVRATPRFTAGTRVLLEMGERAPTDTGSVDYRFGDRSYIENQLAILASDQLLRRVVLKERLFEAQTPTTNETQNADKEAISQAEAQSILDGINTLRGALSVSRSGQAQVLNISITWGDPARAAQLANAVADAYVVNQLDARFDSAKRASGWLSDRLVDLRQQLSNSEQAVTKFRTEHGLTRSGATVALNDQQLADLNSKLIAARTEAAEKKTRVDFLADVVAGKKSLDSLPDSFQSTSSVMGPLRAKLADASQRAADLLARYNSRHPAVVNVEAERRDIERNIAAETQRLAQTVRSDYALAKARLDAMEQAMREATGQGELNNEDSVRLRELERTATVNKSLFEDFLQKAKITDEQSTFRAREVRIIEPAQFGMQTFPNRNRVLMMAMLMGFGIGVGGAFAMELLKAGFTTPREVEDMLGIPVLASVRRMNKSQLAKDGKTIFLPFYQIHYPLSPFSEAMRTLRSGIHMSDVDRPPKIIHVTSSRPGEGKSTIAISLAVSAASSNLKVVLVDADLRHPSTSHAFGLDKKRGLVDLLMGTSPPQEVMIFQKDLNLMVIPAGSKTLNPPDVLGSERMRLLVARLGEQFDYVVIDTPPIGPVIDPAIVAKLADKTIFVVQWGSTPRDLVTSSVQQLSSHKQVCGIVLNSVVQERAQKYGGEYLYGKSYDKYYSE
jgi:polysaccharide biosynthesis transport protein